MNFKKVIGHNIGETNRPASAAPEPAAPTPAPAPAAPSYSTPAPQQHQPQHVAARPAPATRNVLSSDVEIKGTVKFTNDLVVDGSIEGEIASEKTPASRLRSKPARSSCTARSTATSPPLTASS